MTLLDLKRQEQMLLAELHTLQGLDDPSLETIIHNLFRMLARVRADLAQLKGA
jgi:hypothetical protein